MTTQHTPGPWIIEFCDSFVGVHAKNERESLICRCDEEDLDYRDGLDHTAEVEANARLIAHAWAIPQLIEALETIAQGKGAYDPDKLKHCSNAVEDMKALARGALDLVKGTP